MFTDGCTDGGQTTDGRQAHRHIPRDFRSGEKKKTRDRFGSFSPVLPL